MKVNEKNKYRTTTGWLNFLDTATNIIIIPILILSVVCSLVMINAKKSNNVPNIFGYSLVTILSESMVESGFLVDDTVMVKKTEPSELAVGDIIAFYEYVDSNRATMAELTKLSKAKYSGTASAEETAEAYGEDKDMPTESMVSSWKLYLSKVLSKIIYVQTEATERAVRANSPIIFHQVVDIIDYDGALWYKTWGTTNVDANGNPKYDSYWIKEDYVIGRYVYTGTAVRSFLAFAGTTEGIIWMVEVPSGLHLILSTLELIEIIDILSKLKKEQVKADTYISRKEYKRMLKEKHKLLKSQNIDVDAHKYLKAPYKNSDLPESSVTSHDENTNINGPPDGAIGSSGGLAPPRGDPAADVTSRGDPTRGDPAKDEPPRGDPNIAFGVIAGANKQSGNDYLMNNVDLEKNQIILTEQELAEYTHSYEWEDHKFLSNTEIAKSGKIVAPSKQNKVILQNNKTKTTYTTEPVGVIGSVTDGIICSNKGIYKVIRQPNGILYERLEYNPNYKVISTKQDKYGNVYIGVLNGQVAEDVSTTSDGKRLSFWNKNALYAKGDDGKLYFMEVDDHFNLARGEVTDIKVITENGRLQALKSNHKRNITFVDSYHKYGFKYLKGNILCLDNGYMFFDVVKKKAYSLPSSAYYLTDNHFVILDNDNKLYKYKVEDFIESSALGKPLEEISSRELLTQNVSDVTIKDNHLICKCSDSRERFVVPIETKLIRVKIDNK